MGLYKQNSNKNGKSKGNLKSFSLISNSQLSELWGCTEDEVNFVKLTGTSVGTLTLEQNMSRFSGAISTGNNAAVMDGKLIGNIVVPYDKMDFLHKIISIIPIALGVNGCYILPWYPMNIIVQAPKFADTELYDYAETSFTFIYHVTAKTTFTAYRFQINFID